MLLYHNDCCLVVPQYLPYPSSLSPEKRLSVRHVYLIMLHPLDYVMLRWKEQVKGAIPLKEFVFSFAHIPQTSLVSSPDETIRLEYFSSDVASLDLSIPPFTLPSLPQRKFCMSSSAYIRRLYKKDFELGDYE